MSKDFKVAMGHDTTNTQVNHPSMITDNLVAAIKIKIYEDKRFVIKPLC